jgi:N-acetylneuraminic acid mutarotase
MKHTLSLTFATAIAVIVGCIDQQHTPLEAGVSEVRPGIPGTLDSSTRGANSVELKSRLLSGKRAFALPMIASSPGSSAVSIPFNPEPGPFANRGPICDDCVSSNLPVGFSFIFYGNTYTTFNISSNGFIGFGNDTVSGCCAGHVIPRADTTNNIIAAAWTDLTTDRTAGRITYETRGTAPSRYLVVDFNGLPWYPNDHSENVARVTTQIILNEGTNFIEIHTTSQTAGNTYTQGVENEAGTRAAFIPGRVSANYGLTNDGVRFTTNPAQWSTMSALPSARRSLAGPTASGLLYAIGGATSAGTALKTVQVYNPSTNAWTTKAPLPAARPFGNGATHISGTIYLPGGQDAGNVLTRTLYAYRISTNNWSAKASMPVFSGCGGSGVIGGKLYVYSGCTRTATGPQTATGLLHRYNPATNTWTTLRGAPSVHVQPAVTVVAGKLYVAGGNTSSGAVTGRVDVYNPSTNSWSTVAAMPTPRVAAAGGVIGGKLYVVGGRNGSTYYNSVEVFDPLTGAWTSAAGMPAARGGLGVGVIDGALYAIGGRNAATAALATNERLTP